MVHLVDKRKRNEMSETEITPSETTEKKLQEIAESTGKSPAELEKMYLDARAFLDKDQYTEQLNDEKAFVRVRSSLRSELSSPAPILSGLILAAGEAFNTNARYHDAAKIQFESDEAQQWIDKGLITEDGKPIDQRKFYSTGRVNPNYGKVVPATNWMRNAFGVLSIGEGNPTPSKITLSRQVALKKIPLGIPVQVRLNNKTPKGVTDEYILNGASVTEFRPIDNPDVPQPETVIEMYCEKYFTTITNLQAVHNDYVLNPDRREGVRARLDPLRMTLLDCYLIYCDESPNDKTGNYRMVVEDDSIGLSQEDEGVRGTVIWLPEHLFPAVKDAGKGTRMFLMGQTTQPQTSIDFTTGERVNEPGDVGINATGLFVRDGWFMDKAEGPIEEGQEVE